MTASMKHTVAGVAQEAGVTEHRTRTAREERARADYLYLMANRQQDYAAADACRAMADACQARAERLELAKASKRTAHRR